MNKSCQSGHKALLALRYQWLNCIEVQLLALIQNVVYEKCFRSS